MKPLNIYEFQNQYPLKTGISIEILISVCETNCVLDMNPKEIGPCLEIVLHILALKKFQLHF